MFGVFRAARKLRDAGVLGMNRRNAECILDRNPRRLYPLVDGKLRLHFLCRRAGIPTPKIYGRIHSLSRLRHLPEIINERAEFVIKPNRGSAGRGVLVIVGRTEIQFSRHNGEVMPLDRIRQHVSDILSGTYSLGGHPDEAFFQQRIGLYHGFEGIACQGIPDIRIILYKGRPAMAMFRLPTRVSGGRANLHQGGIGAGIDLATGTTTHAVQNDRAIDRHPDTGQPLLNLQVPRWTEVLALASQVGRLVGLGYLGVDIVMDELGSPMLLEANARPGLAIQIANRRGLLKRFAEIDENE
jgi:alpha-L-glutamate ligase-like protein